MTMLLIGFVWGVLTGWAAKRGKARKEGEVPWREDW
jgi:hypothetical protein